MLRRCVVNDPFAKGKLCTSTSPSIPGGNADQREHSRVLTRHRLGTAYYAALLGTVSLPYIPHGEPVQPGKRNEYERSFSRKCWRKTLFLPRRLSEKHGAYAMIDPGSTCSSAGWGDQGTVVSYRAESECNSLYLYIQRVEPSRMDLNSDGSGDGGGGRADYYL